MRKAFLFTLTLLLLAIPIRLKAYNKGEIYWDGDMGNGHGGGYFPQDAHLCA